MRLSAVLPDPLYSKWLLVLSTALCDGKRGTAASIVYGAFEQIKETTGTDALEVFETAMENIMPVLEVRARRVGDLTTKYPVGFVRTVVQRETSLVGNNRSPSW